MALKVQPRGLTVGQLREFLSCLRPDMPVVVTIGPTWEFACDWTPDRSVVQCECYPGPDGVDRVSITIDQQR